MCFKTAHSLQSSGLRSALPKGQFLVLMKAATFLHSHYLSCLGIVGRSRVLLEDPFQTTEEGHVKRGVTTPSSMSS